MDISLCILYRYMKPFFYISYQLHLNRSYLVGEYFLIVLAFWWQWILIIRDPHANMYYLLRSPNNLNHLYVHTPTLMWSDYHWQMLSQHSSFISKCEEKQKVASERKWCSICFAEIMLVKMIEVIFLTTLLCGCNVIGKIEVFLTKNKCCNWMCNVGEYEDP